MNKIDKLNKKSNEALAILEVKNVNQIKKIDLNNKILKAKQSTINIEHENILLNNENGLFGRLKRNGIVLSLLSILSFITSMILSLISGFNVIHNIYNKIGFSLLIIICQIIIFISSKYSSIVREKFFHHYSSLKLMQLFLLGVSITLNIIFFYECFSSFVMTLILLPLAFIIDYSTIFFSSLAYDSKTLNFYKHQEIKTLFEMLIDNLTHGIKAKIQNTYSKHHELITPTELPRDTEVKHLNTLTPKIDNTIELITPLDEIDNTIGIKTPIKTPNTKTPNDYTLLIKQAENYIKENYKIDDKIDVKEIQEHFNITRKIWDTQIRSKLNNIVIEGKRTLRAC
jgi:hypothetical protein